MKSDGLSFFTDTHLPLIGLVIFFSLFVILTWMQIRGYDKKKIDVLEHLPMEGD
jgi:hypothetical protein